MEKKNVEAVVAEKFDRKGFFSTVQKAFAKSKDVDVVADTEREESINATEYEYIHFFKKGTTKNLFQMYVKSKNVKFVVGMTLKDFLKQGEKYTIDPIEKKNKDGEKKVTCVVVTCEHEDAIAVAETIISAYQTKISTIVEVPEKKTKKDVKAKETKKRTKKDA